ncbi:AfsR/SARP family transcriptional regulator [Micromonospora sp. DT53]|uniref:AfsR/SARP family transcriptional regulator n=1 Tax=Micromonospora sp. DT53 TaxID=3393444 RepID=UPI003CF58454
MNDSRPGNPPAITSEGGHNAEPPSVHVPAHPSGRQTDAGADRIRVQVLGTPTILGVPDGQHIRPQAMEFLVYLIVRGGSAYQHDILGDLIPEPPHRLATQRLHTYTYNLRQIFRSISGDNVYLRLRRHHYTLNIDAFDVDLWTMRDAITAAQHASSPAASTAALRRAFSVYRGPLAANTGYLWLVRHRQAASREFLTAAVNLAEALADSPTEANAVLDIAAHHHPDDELLAAAAATIRLRLG